MTIGAAGLVGGISCVFVDRVLPFTCKAIHEITPSNTKARLN